MITCPQGHQFTHPHVLEGSLTCPTCGSTIDEGRVRGVDVAVSRTTTHAAVVDPDGTVDVPDGNTVPSSRQLLGGFFGGYELLEKIGEGGMGAVYRARQIQADRVVALKVVRPQRLAGTNLHDAVQRFQIEARAAARLDHDHITPVFEVGEVDGSPFYSMRFIEGENLERLLTRELFSPRRAAACLEPVCRALNYAHGQGVLHRDVKPSNLLLDGRTGRVMIADFGLAKLDDGGTMTLEGQVFGSPPYMSPEQALGGAVTAHSDIYSTGATLYHLLTGRPPFRAESVPQTLKLVVEQEPVPPRRFNPGIDRDLENICLKCLEKNPQRRYESAGALADDLQRYLEGATVHARPIGQVRRATRWCRRRPVTALMLAAVLCVAAAGLAIWNSRPAHLSVHVVPATAQLLLDGQPIKPP
jgi:serine/threonine-protein kinase